MAKQAPKAKARPKARYELLEGELPDLYEELKRNWGGGPYLEAWLDTPHLYLDLRTPRELLGTKDEFQLRDLLRRIRFIGVT